MQFDHLISLSQALPDPLPANCKFFLKQTKPNTTTNQANKMKHHLKIKEKLPSYNQIKVHKKTLGCIILYYS